VTDLLGRPAVLRLTAGNVADIAMAGPLLDVAGRVRCLIADKGYEANSLRKRLKAEGAEAVIPGRSNRKVPIHHDRDRYRGRWRIEAAFCRLKDFRRIATRYDKLARNFLSALALATVIAFWV
jgi:transposase